MKESCGRCHRGLTNPTSIRRGLGPVCYAKVEKEAQEKDKEQPLSDHFLTIVDRFIKHGQLEEKDAEYFRNEAKKALEKNDKGLAVILGYEAVHYAISGKAKLNNISSLIQAISNMFDLASEIKEAQKQEKYLKKKLYKMDHKGGVE